MRRDRSVTDEGFAHDDDGEFRWSILAVVILWEIDSENKESA